MKNIMAILFTILIISGCKINNDDNDEIPPPSLPATVYGQLPTRTAIIQTAEAVGASNVQIIGYQMATGTSENAKAVSTNGGIKPSWWREDRAWCSNSYIPALTRVQVVYVETENMHPNWSVKYAIHRLFENAGFYDILYGASPFEVETTVNDGYRLLPLPTHAAIINEVEELGASNVKINLYIVYSVDYTGPPIMLGYISYHGFQHVPSDSSFSALQGDVGHTNPRILRLSYEHPGLGSIITNNDVEDAIKNLFTQYGFASIDVMTTGTQISAGFPLPSFSQITQAAERAGAANIKVNTYKANNTDIIPMNEGSRVANTPVILEISYDGAAIAVVHTNIQALFVNFNNVHIGNNTVAQIPLPSGSEIRQAALAALFFPLSLTYEPSIYTANGESIWPEFAGSAPWNARIVIGIQGDGTNEAVYANLAVQNIKRLFTERGFFNLDITADYP